MRAGLTPNMCEVHVSGSWSRGGSSFSDEHPKKGTIHVPVGAQLVTSTFPCGLGPDPTTLRVMHSIGCAIDAWWLHFSTTRIEEVEIALVILQH